MPSGRDSVIANAWGESSIRRPYADYSKPQVREVLGAGRDCWGRDSRRASSPAHRDRHSSRGYAIPSRSCGTQENSQLVHTSESAQSQRRPALSPVGVDDHAGVSAQ